MRGSQPLQPRSESRENMILTTSLLSVVINLLLAGVKILIGIATGSIAILTEGTNNAMDSLSSVLTIVGTKLSGKKPTAKHPFGYGRIEYLTSLVIAGIILMTGFEFLKESFLRLFTPSEMDLSLWVLGVIALSAVVKLILGTYMIRQGKRAGSGSLVAVGTECRNDSLISAVTIFSSLVYLFGHISIDAYAGMVISAVILKTGIDTLRETVNNLLGQSAEKSFADKLYHEIRATEGVRNAADMMLHNYGPDAYSGSVNLEIDHEKTIGEIYEVIHTLQLRIMQEYHVTMVFGLYAVDNSRPELHALRVAIAGFLQRHPHATGYHALFYEPEKQQLYCDLVVDYHQQDWEGLEREFTDTIHALHPHCQVHLVIETEYV